jgi:HEAT repeat protein
VALKRLGPVAKAAIPALEAALADTDADVRAAVAEALEAIDPSGRPAKKEPDRPRPPEPPITNPDIGSVPVSSPAARKKPPSTERAAVGSYHFDAKSLPSVLVERKANEDAWHRLSPSGRIFSHDRLVSLPGYASEVRLDSGVHLLLRGHLRELSADPAMDFLQECAVVLHRNKDVDADLTLDRGRLYLSNHKDKGPAVVRLRFEKEVWDLTLDEPGTEVVLDLVKRTAGANAEDAEPLAALFLVVLQGKAALTAGYNHYPMSPAPGPALVSWDNKGAGDLAPRNLAQRLVSLFDKVLPVPPERRASADDVNRALKEISRRLVPDKEPSVVLQEARAGTDQPMLHALAVYDLGALDDVRELLRILGDPDSTHAPDRELLRILGDPDSTPQRQGGHRRAGLLAPAPAHGRREAGQPRHVQRRGAQGEPREAGPGGQGQDRQGPAAATADRPAETEMTPMKRRRIAVSVRLLFSAVAAAACLLGVAGASPPAEDEAAVEAYLPLLKDANPLVRKRAALVLRRQGVKAKTAVPALEAALMDKDAGVRAAVAVALEAIDPMPQPAGARPDGTGADRPAPVGPPARPDMAISPAGRLLRGPGLPALLMERPPVGGRDVWRRVPAGGAVFTAHRLVSLPGSPSTVRMDNGVELLLQGQLREFAVAPWMEYLQESAAVLHRNPAFDLDVTLQRGRFFVTNRKDKGEAHVRLRFGGEVWDLTLREPGAEVAVDLVKNYTSADRYRQGEEPRTELYLFVLAGKVRFDVRVSRTMSGPAWSGELTPPPGLALVMWDNKGRVAVKPQRLETVPEVLSRDTPDTDAARRMRAAVALLAVRLGDAPPLKALNEVVRSDKRPTRLLAIYCLGALDALWELISLAGDEDPARAAEREAAIFTLRRWMSRDAAHDRLLYDPRKDTGLLRLGGRYGRAEAEAFHALLHLFPEPDRHDPATFEMLADHLAGDKVALAELAYWHLARLAGDVKLPDFNAAWPRDKRREVSRAVRKLIADGKLPPRSGPGE